MFIVLEVDPARIATVRTLMTRVHHATVVAESTSLAELMNRIEDAELARWRAKREAARQAARTGVVRPAAELVEPCLVITPVLGGEHC